MPFSAPTRGLFQESAMLKPATYAERLKQRAVELEKELQAIRTRQNTLSLPNRLPAEILSKVFMLVRDMPRQYSWAGHDFPTLDWLKVTQVCQHWRAVAFGYAPLWSRLFVSHPGIMNAMVLRSKGAALDVEFNAKRLRGVTLNDIPAISTALAEGLSQTERLRSIDIKTSGGSRVRLSDILSRASGCAPILSSLKLSVDGASKSDPIPSLFLRAGAPALRKLKLEHIDYPWERLPLSSTLTRLKLTRCTTRPAVVEFYEGLSQLEALEKLSLRHHWLPEIANSISRSSVTLPSLKTIRVEDHTGVLSDFFNIVKLPQVSYMSVKITDRHGAEPGLASEACLENIRTALSGAMQRCPDLVQLSLRNLDLTETLGEPTFHLHLGPRLNGEMDSEATSKSGGEVRLDVVLMFGDWHPSLLQFLGGIDKAFDFSTITALELDCAEELDPSVFIKMFAQLPRLHHISFATTSIRGIFHELLRDPALSAKGEKANSRGHPSLKPYFPALSAIEFSYIDFEEDNILAVAMVDCVVDVLEKRPKANPVKVMYLSNCINFGANEFKMLSKSLPKVSIDWDKNEDWDSGGSELDDGDDFGGGDSATGESDGADSDSDT